MSTVVFDYPSAVVGGCPGTPPSTVVFLTLPQLKVGKLNKFNKNFYICKENILIFLQIPVIFPFPFFSVPSLIPCLLVYSLTEGVRFRWRGGEVVGVDPC